MIIPYKTDFINKCRPPRGGRGLKFHLDHPDKHQYSSPPSRGAWIEIGYQYEDLQLVVVAPLAGGVD